MAYTDPDAQLLTSFSQQPLPWYYLPLLTFSELLSLALVPIGFSHMTHTNSTLPHTNSIQTHSIQTFTYLIYTRAEPLDIEGIPWSIHFPHGEHINL